MVFAPPEYEMLSILSPESAALSYQPAKSAPSFVGSESVTLSPLLRYSGLPVLFVPPFKT